MMESMNRLELQELTVAELRDYIKTNGLNVVGAWKMKKEDLINAIAGPQEELTEVVVEEEETSPRRGNRKSLHVILEDGTELDFESNKEFAEYFNKKHNTNFRNDIAWYIARDRNKKAKQVFEIKEIV